MMRRRVLSIMLILLMVLAFVPAAFASDSDIITFADPKFKAAVLEIMGKRSTDNVTKGEAAEVIILDVSDRNISSLSGIEYFTGLKSLSCDNNQITALDISKNTALTYLDCPNNQLTTLDITKNTEITYIYCPNNQLATLDVSKNTALVGLYCFNNKLTALDVSKNTALVQFSCGGNPLNTLDVSKNTALEYLFCSSNQLTTLDVSKNTKLTYLDCPNNQLTTLDITKNPALDYILCFGNQLTTLDISNNTVLLEIYCDDSLLQTLDYSKNTILTKINGKEIPSVSGIQVSPSPSTVYVNGIKVSFEAYNIGGSNFFKLRDLAAVLNGTDKRFAVRYDDATKSITLTSGKGYTTVGGEMAQGDGKTKTAVPTSSKIYLDGEELNLTVYNVGGNNFFKLRDLMEAIDVYVGYDNVTKNITLDTSKGYAN